MTRNSIRKLVNSVNSGLHRTVYEFRIWNEYLLFNTLKQVYFTIVKLILRWNLPSKKRLQKFTRIAKHLSSLGKSKGYPWMKVQRIKYRTIKELLLLFRLPFQHYFVVNVVPHYLGLYCAIFIKRIITKLYF